MNLINLKITYATFNDAVGRVPIKRIDFCEFAEDGKEFIVQLTLKDNSTAWYSFCPNAPVHARIVMTEEDEQ